MTSVLEFRAADEPLTDGELAYVRSQVKTLREAQRRGVRLAPAENVAARLLATLDERTRGTTDVQPAPPPPDHALVETL